VIALVWVISAGLRLWFYKRIPSINAAEGGKGLPDRATWPGLLQYDFPGCLQKHPFRGYELHFAVHKGH